MSTDTVSIVIPTYNRARYIKRAIDSALDQVEPGDEIIVVDDGSDDDTSVLVRRYGEPVRYIRISRRGAGTARNVGIRNARGALVAFLDSDDEWMPGKLMLQRSVMTSYPDVVFCFSNFATTDKVGKEHRNFLYNWCNDNRHWDEILGTGVNVSTLGVVPSQMSDVSVHIGDMSVNEMRADYILTSTLLVRRSLAKESLLFSADVVAYEDLECFGRLALTGPAAYIDCETAWQHGDSDWRISTQARVTRSASHLKILQRVWGSDRRFLAQHRDYYDEKVRRVRLDYIGNLCLAGRCKEAREQLRLVDNPPFRYKVAASLPGALVPWAHRRLKPEGRAPKVGEENGAELILANELTQPMAKVSAGQ